MNFGNETFQKIQHSENDVVKLKVKGDTIQELKEMFDSWKNFEMYFELQHFGIEKEIKDDSVAFDFVRESRKLLFNTAWSLYNAEINLEHPGNYITSWITPHILA